MAKNQTVRLSRKRLKEDNHAFEALKDLEDYNPANQNFTIEIGTKTNEVKEAQEAALNKAARDVKSARDNSVASDWDFHNYILGVKEQVIAQYGKSSNEIQSLGLKKKTEYKKRGETKAGEKPLEN